MTYVIQGLIFFYKKHKQPIIEKTYEIMVADKFKQIFEL